MGDEAYSPDNPAFRRQKAVQSWNAAPIALPVAGDNPAITRQQALEDRSKSVNTEIESPILGGVAGAGLGGAYGTAAAGKDISMAAMKAAVNSNIPFVQKATSLLPGTERWKQSANEISEAAKKVVQDTSIRGRAPQFTRQPWVGPGAKDVAEESSKLAPFIGKLAGLAGKYVVGPVLGGAAAGEQALEGLNRYNQGDKTGALLSAIGTAGDVGSAVGFPEIGIPVSLGAHGINYAREHPEQFNEAMQQSSTLGMKTGGKVKKKKK